MPYPEPCAEDDPAIGALIPLDVCRHVAKAARSEDRIQVSRPDSGATTFAITVQGRGKNSPAATFTGLTVEGASPVPVVFPDWTKIVPTEFEFEIAVSPAYLLDALESLRDLGHVTCRMRFSGQARPIVFEGYGSDFGDEPEHAPFMVVMPMHTDSSNDLRGIIGGEATPR